MNKDEIPIYLFKMGVPWFEKHSIDFIIESNDNTLINELILAADIYSKPEELWMDSSSVSVLHTFQTRCYEEVSLGCRFNHHFPTYYLLIELEYDGDMFLELGSQRLKLLKTGEVDNIKIYTLTKSLDMDDLLMYGINFSRIDKPIISVDDKTNNYKSNISNRPLEMAQTRPTK